MDVNTQMRTDYSAIALVIDRSGSMWNIAEDTKGGIKQFINTQKQQEGKAALTVVQFDHEYQVFNDFSDLNTVDADAIVNQFHPRGSTALLDAIGRTIIEMSQKIESMEAAERPARKVVAIVTDGAENASTDFTAAKIKALVEEKQAQGWDFVFLGADLNTMTVAQHYGFKPDQIAYYQSTNLCKAMRTIEEKVTGARTGKVIAFSPEERTALVAPKI